MKKHSFLLLGFLFCLFSASAVLEAQETGSLKGYVNARDLANSLGVTYRWFPMQRMVILSKGTQIMRLTIDNSAGVVDNKPLSLPGAPVLKEGQVFVPAKSIIQVFGSDNQTAVKPKDKPAAKPVEPQEEPDGSGTIDPETPAEEEEEKPVKIVPPPPVLPTPSPTKLLPPVIITEKPDDEESVLTAVRHSKRDDSTRVVLEFDGPVTFSSETPGENKFKVRIQGCKNVFPQKRPNPVGRDLKGMSFNSGANRKGLVLGFDLPPDAPAPTAELVSNPTRLVLTFKASPEAIAAASATAALTASSTPAIKNASGTAKIAKDKIASDSKKIEGTKPGMETARLPDSVASEPPAIPEITIDVPLASLSRAIFAGRTVVIDPGHGGGDSGIAVQGFQSEKQVTLALAQKLKQILKQAGFNVFVVRSGDNELSYGERTSLANKTQGDLFISLHVGASQDDTLEGTACYYFDPSGSGFDQDSGQKISPQLVFQEWCRSYRFDLAKFLAMKVNDRLTRHLGTPDRGVRALDLLPLRFLLIPGILVEVGMGTNGNEVKKLSSKGYQEAIAKSVSNGVVDFFNAIKLNQEP